MPNSPASIEPSAFTRAIRYSAPRRRAADEPSTAGPNAIALSTVGVSDRPSLNTP